MARLLILENAPEYRESLLEALRQRPTGLEPSDVYVKFDEAPPPASVSGVSLALVDHRAQDDEREDDDTGLVYAIDLEKAGTRAVLVSAYPQAVGRLFDLLRQGSITGIVDKRCVSVHCLILCTEHFLQFRYFPNGIATFGWLPRQGPEGDGVGKAGAYLSKDWRVLQDALGSEVQMTIGEIEVLLRALVSPCATRIDLGPIELQGQSGTLVLKAEVTCADAPVVETLAIKLGKKQTVLSEKLRYDRFVGPLPDGVATQLRWHAQTANLAAIAYTWVDDSVEEGIEFRRLVSRNNTPVVWRRGRNAIDRLFRTSLHPWHKVYLSNSASEHPKSDETLLDHYLGRGGLWYEGQRSLGDIVGLLDGAYGVQKGKSEWQFRSAGGAVLPNPLSWVQEFGTGVKIGRASPVHGDLHVGNLFVLSDDSPRMIDFGRTDMGHVFRDFAALEASIRIALASQVVATQFVDKGKSIADDPSTLSEAIKYAIQSEDSLCAADHLGDWVDTNACRASDMGVVFAECLQLTLTIRRAARDACGAEMPVFGFAQYLFALTMHFLRYATSAADELPDAVRRQTDPFRLWVAHYAAARTAQKAASVTI